MYRIYFQMAIPQQYSFQTGSAKQLIRALFVNIPES